MLDATAVAAIGAYRRYLSPHKGFCCACRRATVRRWSLISQISGPRHAFWSTHR